MEIRFDRDEFLQDLDPHLPLASLFDVLPDVYLYVKDRQSRFVHVNRAWLDIRGFDSVDQVCGLTDFDIHPRHLAARYVREDQQVMKSGNMLPHQVWLVPAGGTELRWFISSKTPLRNTKGDVCGIAGAMRDFEAAGEVFRPYAAMQNVLAYVARNFEQSIAVPDLAKMVGLSVSQFERRFKQTLQMTPRQYIQRVRANAACETLVATELSVAEVAAECGYYDQSYFTKQFKRFIGLTPLAYRKQARTGEVVPR